MLARLAVLLALATLALGGAACATSGQGAKTDEAGKAGKPSSTPFEAWAVSNGTGAFFKAVGPAGGSGVRSAWP